MKILNISHYNQQSFLKNGQQTQDIKHRHLTSYCKNDLMSARHIEAVIKNCPSTSRYVGSLPYQWLKDVPYDKRSEFSKKIFDLFSKFAKNMKIGTNSESETLDEHYMNLFCRDFFEITHKKPKLSKLGSGTIGRTFKFDVDNESYVIKTFYTGQTGYGYYSTHGKGTEILSALYVDKNYPKNDYAKFYFGKFARRNDYDGFMVTKYINSKNAHVKTDKITVADYFKIQRVNNDDSLGYENRILDTIIDYGGISKPDTQHSIEVYKMQRMLLEAIYSGNFKNYQALLKKYSSKDLDEVISHSVYFLSNIINLYKENCFENDIEPIEDTSIITNKLKNRIYRLLVQAMKIGSIKMLNDVISEYGKTKEFGEVIKTYNPEMPLGERSRIETSIQLREYLIIENTMQRFGLVS